MPEGDTIHRTAATLDRWLGGRVITAARGSALSPTACDSLVGDSVMAVEANGKHVLMRLASGRTIHSHMRMQGAWHVYPTGRTWHRPGFEARLVLEAGERQAVCFNAPVVSLANTPAVDHLGPDLITEPVDFDAIAHRVALQPATLEVGDLLLDQRVAAGIGNIWRCETLFRHGVHPQAPLGSVPSPLDLYRTASK